MKSILQQIKYQRMTQKKKSITQNNLKKIIIKRKRVKIELENILEGEQKILIGGLN